MKQEAIRTSVPVPLWLRPQCLSLLLLAALAMLLGTIPAHAQTLTLLHSFTGKHGDGMLPETGVILDSANTLYGVTAGGGAFGFGIIFKIDAAGRGTVLHTFAGGIDDGAIPRGALLRDGDGNLWGTTASGGANNMGTVFELDTAGVLHVLHSFNSTDGRAPNSGLVRKDSENFYGTTYLGGDHDQGTVYEVNRSGSAFRVLHSFENNASDGFLLQCVPVLDPEGNLYGTTVSGGKRAYGIVWRLSPGGTETILASFNAGIIGGSPMAGLLRDSDGNLYGTTGEGGSNGGGTLFSIDPARKLTVLHDFNGSEGSDPTGPLIRDAAGTFYGMATTDSNGDQGLIYKLDASGTYTVLYAFSGLDGSIAMGPLVQDASGKLYGTTYRGGAKLVGEVFKLTP